MATFIDLKDAFWSKARVDGPGVLDARNPRVLRLLSLLLALHRHTPLKWCKLQNDELELWCLDNRKWIVKFLDRDRNGRVTFTLNPLDTWKRGEMISAHINPVTDAVLDLYVDDQITFLDIRPV